MTYTINELRYLYSSHFCSCDIVYLSSSLGLLGLPSDLTSINSGQDLARFHLDIILDCLLPSQTLVIPGFSYSFSTNKDVPSYFCLDTTPPQIGELPLLVFGLHSFSRSIDPFLSVFTYGPLSNDLTNNLPYTSYGYDSIFDRLSSYQTRVVSVGLGSHWLPFLHYGDFLCDSPFRYPKTFMGTINSSGSDLSNIKWTYHVRLPLPNTYPHTYELASLCHHSSKCLSTEVGRSSIFSYDYSLALKSALPIISADPWVSVVGPPLTNSRIEELKTADLLTG